MTCKVSFHKALKGELKSHAASAFAVSVIFLIKLITSFLSVQNTDFDLEREILFVVNPGLMISLIVMGVALLLGYDFFRYMHSSRQTDFFGSLPVTRLFALRVRLTACGIIFFIPFLVCRALELVIINIFAKFRAVYLINSMWTVLAMALVFTAALLTAILAMTLTGNSVVAVGMFGILAGYFPIFVRSLIPAFEGAYFKTFLEENSIWSVFSYFSPVGAAVKLCDASAEDWAAGEHAAAFIALAVIIVTVGIIDCFLIKIRPGETAGSAIAFPKLKPVLRIMLVIPLSLYAGLYIGELTKQNRLLIVTAIILTAFLAHGIIESVFEFDIRALLTHKIQMFICMAASLIFTAAFWITDFRFDEYLPRESSLDSMAVQFVLEDYPVVTQRVAVLHGLTGENLKKAHLLAKDAIKSTTGSDEDVRYNMHVEYRLKNGFKTQRRYSIDIEKNIGLVNDIFTTREYKYALCPLYGRDLNDIGTVLIGDDFFTVPVPLTKAEANDLIGTYLDEFEKITYDEWVSSPIVASISVETPKDTYTQCNVYAGCEKTAALINGYIAKYSLKDIRPVGTR